MEISRTGQTVLTGLIESQIQHLLAYSVALCGDGSEKKLWPLPAFLPGTSLSPNSHPDTGHFNFFLYVTGAFQAATLVLLERGSESEWVSPCVGSLRGTA